MNAIKGEGEQIVNDTMGAGNLFPVRFLGFGFFWAWLFLAGVTPSPLVGSPVCFAGAPFEMVELSMRALGLIVAFVIHRQLATDAGQYILLAVGIVGSTLAAPLALAFGATEAGASLSAIAAAAGEVSMFLLWLCFFGYMKLGETFKLLVGSYGVGSVLFLVAVFLGFNAMAAASVLYPLLSGAAFVLSKRLSVARMGEKLFGVGDASLTSSQESLSQESGDISQAGRRRAVFDVRTAVALIMYSFVFALSCGIALFASEGSGFSFTAEPAAMIVLSLVCLAFFLWARRPDRPYVLYRAVAPVIGLGLALFMAGLIPAFVMVFFTAFGYVLFELLVLNDCCNVARINDASLLRRMTLARLAITIGLFFGWLTVFVVRSVEMNGAPWILLACIGSFVTLIAVALVFTERDLASFAAVAEDRAVSENKIHSREDAVTAFAEQNGLSRRETEVTELLLAGRTTSFAAEKLFVAESTVRAHVHSIYRKCDVHTRMDLMDAFEEFCSPSNSKDAEDKE